MSEQTESNRVPQDYVSAFMNVRKEANKSHTAAIAADLLPMWVVLGPGTTDYPGQYLARMWVVNHEGSDSTSCLIIANTLEEVLAMLPPGLTKLERSFSDDPNILEVWI
jgi:hypothetical protein